MPSRGNTYAEPEEPGRITQLIGDWKAGKSDAQKELFDLLYEELRATARRQRRGMPGAAETVNTTALIHEVYLKFDRAGDVVANDRGHFLIVASRAMRQILIDYARQRRSKKRGGDAPKVTLGPGVERESLIDQQGEHLLDIDLVLQRLEEKDERLARVVELRFFGGLTYDEIADALEIGRSTVSRDWQFARAWLQAEPEEMRDGESEGMGGVQPA